VLETTWHTPAGWLVVHDLLVMGRTDASHRRADYRRGPAGFGATGVLLRTATCIGGEAEVMVDCSPLFGYGATGGTWSYLWGAKSLPACDLRR
jgi:alpha,alpha-trehalase